MKLYKRSSLLVGVGINDADYNVVTHRVVNGKQVITGRCPFYQKWSSMISRCYRIDYQNAYPTYKDCTVCKEWLTFSNFKAWMEKQDWEGNHLDKDLLLEGNKVYSPETCVFIPLKINSFLLSSGASRGESLLGVTVFNNGYIMARCNDPFKKRSSYLGYFKTQEEAHQAWKERKHQYAVDLANSEFVTDDRVKHALITRFKQ